MPQIDPVILQLRADVARYNADIRNTTRSVQLQLDAQSRSVISLERQMEASTRNIGASIGTLRKSLLASASLLAGAFGANELKNLADGYTQFTNRLKVAGLEGAALATTQENLFGIAQKYGQQLEAVGGLYGGASAAAKELGASQANLLKFTNGVSAALKIQGGSAASSAGALQQLSQLLGGVNVQAEEYNSINDGARPVLQAVADGIDRYGGSIAKLRAEVVEGKLTSREFFEGFLSGSAKLEAQAARANLTIAASFTVLNNALGKYIGETDQALSITARISAGIATLADNLNLVVPALATIGVAFGARFVAGNAAIAAATAATALHIKALNQENVVILGGAVATAQKATAAAASAAAEVTAIESVILARRADQASIAQTLALIEAQRAAALQAQAAMATNAKLGFGTAVGYGRNDAARATQDHKAQLATRRALSVVNAELTASENALAAAQSRAAATAGVAAAANERLTLTARASALASNLLSKSLILVGGSVGAGAAILGIGALIAALLYFRSTVNDGSTAVATLTENGSELESRLNSLASASGRAASGIAAAGAQADSASGKMRAFAGQVGEAADKLYELARARRREAAVGFLTNKVTADTEAAAAIARIQQRNTSGAGRIGIQNQRDREANERDTQIFRAAQAQSAAAYKSAQAVFRDPLQNRLAGSELNNGRDVEGDLTRVTRDLIVARKRGIKAQIDSLEAQKYELTQYKVYRKAGLSPQAAQEASGRDASALRNAAAGAQGDRDTKASGRARSKADREAAAATRVQAAEARDTAGDNRAFAAAERQANNEIAGAKADLSGSATARATIEKARLEAERISRNDDLAEQAKQGRFGEGDVSKARVLELQTLNDQRVLLEGQVVDLRERQRIDREALDLQLSGFDNQREFLSEQARLATTAGDRRLIELQLLDLARKEEEARLRAVLAINSTASDAERKAAQDRLSALPGIYGAREEGINRDSEGPLARYRRDITGDINEQIENVEVQGLRALEDSLLDSTKAALGLSGAMGDIVGELIRIGIQRRLIGPLADRLFGAAEGGGGGGSISGLLGGLTGLLGGGSKLVGGSPNSPEAVLAQVFGNNGNILKLPGLANGGAIRAGGLGGIDKNVLSVNGVPRVRISAHETLSVVDPNVRATPARGNTTIVNAPQYSLKGAVVTSDLIREMEARNQASSAALIDANNKGLRAALPAASARFSKLGTTG